MKKRTAQKLLAASILACVASASHAGDVDWWSYSIDMKWTAADFDPATDATTSGFQTISPTNSTMLSWGHKGGIGDFLIPYTGHSQARSSLYIAEGNFRNGWSGYYGPKSGQTTINMFRHTNNAIPATTADLTYAQLTMSVELGAWNGSSYVGVPALDIKFDIYFYETPNINANVDDFLLFAKHEGSASFKYDGEWYSFDYAVSGLTQFDAATCSSVSKGALTGSCWGLSVPEYTQATPQLSFGVSAVPEPGTYAMLLAGLGLIGTIVRRRRNTIHN